MTVEPPATTPTALADDIDGVIADVIVRVVVDLIVDVGEGSLEQFLLFLLVDRKRSHRRAA